MRFCISNIRLLCIFFSDYSIHNRIDFFFKINLNHQKTQKLNWNLNFIIFSSNILSWLHSSNWDRIELSNNSSWIWIQLRVQILCILFFCEFYRILCVKSLVVRPLARFSLKKINFRWFILRLLLWEKTDTCATIIMATSVSTHLELSNRLLMFSILPVKRCIQFCYSYGRCLLFRLHDHHYNYK